MLQKHVRRGRILRPDFSIISAHYSNLYIFNVDDVYINIIINNWDTLTLSISQWAKSLKKTPTDCFFGINPFTPRKRNFLQKVDANYSIKAASKHT